MPGHKSLRRSAVLLSFGFNGVRVGLCSRMHRSLDLFINSESMTALRHHGNLHPRPQYRPHAATLKPSHIEPYMARYPSRKTTWTPEFSETTRLPQKCRQADLPKLISRPPSSASCLKWRAGGGGGQLAHSARKLGSRLVSFVKGSIQFFRDQHSAFKHCTRRAETLGIDRTYRYKT